MARLLAGRVTSDKNHKTIVISVATRKTHPIYKKQYTVNRKFMAHDEKNEAKAGDLVIIRECRPRSARKRFTLLKITEKAEIGFKETDATADVPQEAPEGAEKEERREKRVETVKKSNSEEKES